MKLIRNQKVTYYECICTGSLVMLAENKPLAGMLLQLQEGNMTGFQEEALKPFANGLIYSFERDGYLNSGVLTPAGKEIIRTQKAWKKLRGQFKLSVVRTEKNIYIVDFVPHYGDDTSGFSLRRDIKLSFPGEFENNRNMKIKDVVIDPNCWIGKEREIDLDCIYQYETGKNSYSIQTEKGSISFPENVHTFKLVDNSDANDYLRSALAPYGCFTLQDHQVILAEYSAQNPLIDDVLKSIFRESKFDVANDEARFEDIRISILDEAVAEQILYKYLMKKASEQYCGISEIRALIPEFYSLFEDCKDIRKNSQMVFESLLEESSRVDATAFLHLQAVRDLAPHSDHEHYTAGVKDYSNQKMSINDIVLDIVGKGRTALSVTLITKYAYRNASIARALGLFADSLHRHYNIPLRLITARDTDKQQAEVARDYYVQLRDNENILLTEMHFEQLQKIHDRYYRIEYDNGVTWKKMSGELDGLRYPGDYANGITPRDDISITTKGNVKEMTVFCVDESGIPATVRALMEV